MDKGIRVEGEVYRSTQYMKNKYRGKENEAHHEGRKRMCVGV